VEQRNGREDEAGENEVAPTLFCLARSGRGFAERAGAGDVLLPQRTNAPSSSPRSFPLSVSVCVTPAAPGKRRFR
jgi:hypothetical protein